MKVVILAGGTGTRISEETVAKPKPMVEIGGKPLIWHIMKIYSYYGINDFIICLGYKGNLIKEYFANYFLYMSDVTYDMQHNKLEIHKAHAEPWKVTMVDTGLDTMTGGRLLRIRSYLDPHEPFLMTYGDGVSDVNISELVDFHKQQNKLATLTAIQPQGKFGQLKINNHLIAAFNEKPKGDGGWINGGFFVLSPQVFDYIPGDETIWEKEPLIRLTQENQLNAFKHTGFWQNMDTLRDKNLLEELWHDKQAPWCLWA